MPAWGFDVNQLMIGDSPVLEVKLMMYFDADDCADQPAVAPFAANTELDRLMRDENYTELVKAFAGIVKMCFTATPREAAEINGIRHDIDHGAAARDARDLAAFLTDWEPVGNPEQEADRSWAAIVGDDETVTRVTNDIVEEFERDVIFKPPFAHANGVEPAATIIGPMRPIRMHVTDGETNPDDWYQPDRVKSDDATES
jgi:hypothetical protein